MHCPRAPTLESSKGRRPKNRHSLKSGKVKLFSADRGHHVPAPKGGMSGRLCPVCVSLLCLLVALVGWSWSPVALGFCPGLPCVFSCDVGSGSALRGRRPQNRRVLSGTPYDHSILY